MQPIKIGLFLVLFFGFVILSFYIETRPAEPASPKYVLVKDWLQLPKDFHRSQVSAIGVDTNQNVLFLQRTDRTWGDTLPDSLISSNTIFIVNKETGRVINGWGANVFIMPHGLTVDHQNNVWVTDVALNQVFKFNHNGELLMKLGIAKTPGSDSLHFNEPTDVAVANDESFYVSDGYKNSRVVKFSKEGKYLFEWGKKGTGMAEFKVPHSIALDSHGNVYVADRENNRIQKFNARGNFLKAWKNNEAKVLYALAVSNDNVYAVDDVYDSLQKGDDIIGFDSNLNLRFRFGRNDKSIDTSCLYHDIAVDKYENIYVADIQHLRIQKFRRLPN